MEKNIMSHKQQQIYNVLIAIIVILFAVMPVQIKTFWYGLRIIFLSSIIIFLRHIVRSADTEVGYRIYFKSYFWLQVLIYIIYRQYSVSNSVYLSIILGGYMVALTISFVYGKKIKWTNSSFFLVIESGLFAFMIFDIFR